MELRALLGAHRVEELLHLRHRLRHLLEQLVEALRVAGEEVAVPFHEPVEVGLLAPFTLFEHLIELVEHVFHLRHALGGHVLHALGELVEVALHELLAQLIHQLLEPFAGRVVHEFVFLERLHLAREVGRKLLELPTTLIGDVFHELLAALVTRARGLLDPAVDALALHVDDFVELLSDVVVDPAEVTVLELLPATLPELLQHLSQAHELLVVAVLEPLLHEPAERRVEVAVVEEVVTHFIEELLGVEIEAGLAAVPTRVSEPVDPLAREPLHGANDSEPGIPASRE